MITGILTDQISFSVFISLKDFRQDESQDTGYHNQHSNSYNQGGYNSSEWTIVRKVTDIHIDKFHSELDNAQKNW